MAGLAASPPFVEISYLWPRIELPLPMLLAPLTVRIGITTSQRS